MAEIKTIVDVQIDRATKIPSQVGFGVPLVLDINTKQAIGAVDTVAELSEMLDLGFVAADEAYKAVNREFSQNPRPPEVRVARREVDVKQVENVSIDTVANNTNYIVTLNGVAFDYLSDGDATDLEIRDGLIALIDADPLYDALLVDATNFTVTAATAGVGFSAVYSADLSGSEVTANVGIASEIARVQETESDWYFLISTSRTVQDILAAAAAIESLVKMYFYETDEADTANLPDNTDVTSIGAQLKLLGYDRTCSLYTKTSNLTNYPAAGWVGKVGPDTPGSVTWKFKNITGILPDDELTSTQRKNLLDKNVNFYETVSGLAIINSDAKVASGEYNDIIRGTDKLTSRIQENVFGLLANAKKVPFTNKGGDMLGTQVQTALDEAVEDGLLRGGNDAPTISIPKVEDISLADRGNRIFGDITFEAIYAGAVHKVRVRGTISI